MPRIPAEPISKADAARAKQVTAQAVTMATRKGGPLFTALLPGGRIDQGHPAYLAWLRNPAGKPPRPDVLTDSVPPPSRPTDDDPPEFSLPETGPELTQQEIVARYGELTLREIVSRFGTIRAFNDLLDALQKIESIRKNFLSNEETEERLISRELVRAHVFGALEELTRKLLRDAAKTIPRRVYGLAKSGAGMEEAETVVLEILSSHIKPTKAKAVRVLRDT